MRKFHITVKNYRCFEDASPLQITIQDGFVALVGPNNSGKSSCLKLFYELRNLWQGLSSVSSLIQLNSENKTKRFEYVGVFDNQEIYSDSNDRDLVLEIKLDIYNPDKNHDQLSKIDFICNRQSWHINLYAGKAYTKLSKSNLDNVDKIRLRDQQKNIEADCSAFIQLFKDLSSSVYIGPFRNAISEGTASYFDLSIGTQFIDQWNGWKTGATKKDNLLIEKITEDIRNIFEFKTLEINASQNLKTLQFIINNKPYKLKELGAGISQFVIVLGNIAIRKPSYIFIDEPELNLHPSLQLDFLTTIGSYTEKSVVYATHSIGLARSSADLIYSFTRKSGKVIVKSLERQNSYSEFLGEMSFSSYREMGFESVLFVEGVNDVKTAQQFLRSLKKDHKVIIIPLGGDQLIDGARESELSELKRLSEKIHILIDSERTDTNKPIANKRQEFIDVCSKLGFEVCATEYRAIENYFSEDAIKSAIGPEYVALTPYEKLSECKKPWNKSENWKIARAMELDDIKKTDVGEFLSKI